MLQQYISELKESEFIKYEEKDNKEFVFLTKKGDTVLSLFKDRLSTNKTAIIDDYLSEKAEQIKKELNL